MKTLKVILMAIVTLVLSILSVMVLWPKKIAVSVLNKDKELSDKIEDIKTKINNRNNIKDEVNEDWFKE